MPRVHLALATVALLFSVNYIISKLGMREFSPLTFAWLRVFGAALLMALLARGRTDPPLTRRDRREIFLFAVLGVVVNQTLFLGGLSLTSVPVAAVLITTIPVFALAAAIALGREKPTGRRIAGIVLACAGALLIVGGEKLGGSWRSLLGATMLIVNCLSYALYLVLSKPAMERLPARRVVARMFAIGAGLLLPIAAVPLWRERWSAISAGAWIALLVVILGPTVGAYLLNAWALRHAESSLVAAYTYVQPVLATILGAVILGEHLRGSVAVAATMIFGGVWLAGQSRGSRIED